MFRKTIVALAATALIATAALTPTTASAGGGGGGGHGGGHGFGGHGFGGHGFGWGLGAVGVLSAAAVASSCWQYQTVLTRNGYYKRILVNVCD